MYKKAMKALVDISRLLVDSSEAAKEIERFFPLNNCMCVEYLTL